MRYVKKNDLGFVFLVSVCAASFQSVAATTSTAPSPTGIPLANVNGTVITVEDFNRKYQENAKFFQFRAPSKENVLDDLIKRELGIQEAKRMKLDQSPEIVERMNTVLYQSFLEKKLSKEFQEIHVTDGEAQAYYKKYPEVRTSHIFVSLPPGVTPEQQKQAYERIKKIKNTHLNDKTMSFAEVAQRYSEGVAAPMGGDIDFQSRDRLDPVYYETALKLKTVGKVSDIIQTPFGYHIVKLTAIRSWDEADKAQIKRLVFEERRAQLFEKEMAALKKRAKITIRSELLK